jgi:hypothetical protein
MKKLSRAIALLRGGVGARDGDGRAPLSSTRRRNGATSESLSAPPRMKIETITSRELLAECAQRTSGSNPCIT